MSVSLATEYASRKVIRNPNYRDINSPAIPPQKRVCYQDGAIRIDATENQVLIVRLDWKILRVFAVDFG